MSSPREQPGDGGEGEVGACHGAVGVEHHDAGRRRLENLLVVTLQRGHPCQLTVDLIEELSVLDGECRLVEERADDFDIFARQRQPVVAQRGQRQTDLLAADQQGEGIAIAGDIELLLGGRRFPRQPDRREGLELALPEPVAQRREGDRARDSGVRPHRNERRSLEEEEVRALEIERLLDFGQERLAEPVEVAFLKKVLRHPLQSAAMAERPAVLQALERTVNAAVGGDDQADRQDAADEGEQIAGETEADGHRAPHREVDQREGRQAEDQRQGVGKSVADHDAQVPQAIAQHRPGEGERHAGERQHRQGRQRLRQVEAENLWQAVEEEERQVARRHADEKPEELALLLPVLQRRQPSRQHDHRERREEQQVGELDPVEQGQQPHARRAHQEVAVRPGEIGLEEGQHRRREVEERQPAPALRRRGAWNRQEEVQRQRRQQEPSRFVEEVDPAAEGIGRQHRGEDIEHRGDEAPEVEQRPAGDGARPPDDEQPDRRIGAADEGQDQIGRVEIERRAAVLDGLEALLAQDDELGGGGVVQDGGEARCLARLGPVDEDDAVPGLEGGLEQRVDGAHLPVVAGGDRLETERLKGLELLLKTAGAQDRERSGGHEQEQGGESPRTRELRHRIRTLSRSIRNSTFHATEAWVARRISGLSGTVYAPDVQKYGRHPEY